MLLQAFGRLFPVVILSLVALVAGAQGSWRDTSRTTVKLTRFRPSKKVVKVEYGKVIMYFNQKDYLGKKLPADTLRVTPKYIADDVIVQLLKKGKVMVIRRRDSMVAPSIVHYLEQVGSTAYRIFELPNGTSFFRKIAFYGIPYWEEDSYVPSKHVKTVDTPKPVIKEFAYEETFANLSDTHAIRIKDYLPASPASYYVYNDNRGYGELDTNVCRAGSMNKQPIFYFAECFNKYNIVSTGTTMFGKGIYFYRNDSLFTIEAGSEKDIPEAHLNDAALLLPASLRPGDSVILRDKYGFYTQVLTYLSQEDLETSTCTYKDCIKLKITDHWPDTIYLQYVWLQRDLGLVKWMRSTGLAHELVDQFTITGK